VIVAGLALILPVVEVGCVRVANPPVTPLMLLRTAEARLAGNPAPERRYEWRDAARISRGFFRCAVAAEDQRFFQHHGFDWKEVRIAQADADRWGRPARGASTITMQCARSLFLWQGRSWLRKGLEAYYTVCMEVLLPKKRILELYANVVEMGDGIYGVEAAAREYFGASAATLTREQAAAIVACFPDPRHRDPRHPSPAVAARITHLLVQERTLKLPPGW
jgi:monofunctional biosynthetic peptidoglycan transglycosylase